MLNFIVGNKDLILNLVCVIIAFVGFIVTMVRTGSVKKSLNAMQEVNEMAYKNLKKSRAQSFTPYEKDYILNPATNELEEKEVPKNVQEYIQSYVDTCLEKALEKFLPSDKVSEDNDHIVDYSETVQDLAVLGDAMELAEDYREKYGLPDTYSAKQIYDFVNQRAQSLKSSISKVVDEQKIRVDEVSRLQTQLNEIKTKLSKIEGGEGNG